MLFIFQEREFGVYFIFYEIFIILWVIFGLGYLLMITGFIARGLRSKKVARIEHQISMGIKQTQNRIWSNVTRDVGYLRKMLNEIYMMKFQVIYNFYYFKFILIIQYFIARLH